MTFLCHGTFFVPVRFGGRLGKRETGGAHGNLIPRQGVLNQEANETGVPAPLQVSEKSWKGVTC